MALRDIGVSHNLVSIWDSFVVWCDVFFALTHEPEQHYFGAYSVYYNTVRISNGYYVERFEWFL